MIPIACIVSIPVHDLDYLYRVNVCECVWVTSLIIEVIFVFDASINVGNWYLQRIGWGSNRDQEEGDVAPENAKATPQENPPLLEDEFQNPCLMLESLREEFSPGLESYEESNEARWLLVGSSWREIDWGGWGDICFLLGAILTVVDSGGPSHTGIINLIAELFWMLDAVFYLLDYTALYF